VEETPACKVALPPVAESLDFVDIIDFASDLDVYTASRKAVLAQEHMAEYLPPSA
jgi:hypothetical protein